MAVTADNYSSNTEGAWIGIILLPIFICSIAASTILFKFIDDEQIIEYASVILYPLVVGSFWFGIFTSAVAGFYPGLCNKGKRLSRITFLIYTLTTVLVILVTR